MKNAEIEDVEIEIAKAKLELEQLKLKKIQAIFSWMDKLVAVNCLVASFALRYVRIFVVKACHWLGWAGLLYFLSLITFMSFSIVVEKYFGLYSEHDFLYSLGRMMRFGLFPNLAVSALSATVLAFSGTNIDKFFYYGYPVINIVIILFWLKYPV